MINSLFIGGGGRGSLQGMIGEGETVKKIQFFFGNTPQLPYRFLDLT